MIQFNLLPDVKLEYIKARRTKRMVKTICALISAVMLTVFIALLMVVQVAQKQHMSNLNEDIKKDSAKLQAIPEINKILTVQNQLISLPGLHNKKPVTSRLSGYLAQVTPANISISNLKVSFIDNTMNITGSADLLGTVNKFIDTMKFTDFTSPDGSKQGKAFSNVVLAGFTRNDKEATYEVKLNFDPLIFDSSNEIALTVPKIITTRSQTEKPGDLFRQQINPVPQDPR